MTEHVPQGAGTEDQILLLCTRRQLTREHAESLDNLSQKSVIWKRVFETAERHAVAPLIYSHLRQFPEIVDRIPLAVREQFEAAILHNKLRKELAARRIVELVDFFASHELEVMLLKGAAYDQVLYHHPWHTTSQDVDLLINVERQQLAEPVRQIPGLHAIQYRY